MVRHDAAPAQHQAVRAAHPAGRRHGLDHRRGAGGGSYDRGPARQLPHPHVRVHQPWPVRVRDLLPGLPRCERQGRRADLGHERTDSSGAVLRGALPRGRYDRAPHRRLHLRGDRERAGDGARPDAGVRRQGAGQRPLGPRQLRAHSPSASPERERSEAMSVATAGSRAQLVEKARHFPARTFIAYGVVASGVGAAVFFWALTTGQAARAWQSYHVNFMFWTGLAQGLVVFAATQKLAKGHWSGLVIRFAESAAEFLVVALVLFLGLALGRAYIFSWLHEPRPDIGVWLTTKFFFVRNGLIYVALAWLSWRFVRHDMAPDLEEFADGRPAERLAGRDKIAREAAILIVGYAFGYSLLAFDLMMSLAHKWVSNLFGAFYFMGSFLAALMALAVIAIAVRRRMGLASLISSKQLHDLGKLSFGFTVFWAYLMWAQYLVIWYGNLPEETYFIFYRLIGPWKPIGVAVFLMVFVIPFVGLLGVKPKQHPPTFLLFALVSLTGIWLERYLEIVPSINGGAGPALGLPELGVTALFGGLFLLSLGWFAARYPMLSANQP